MKSTTSKLASLILLPKDKDLTKEKLNAIFTDAQLLKSLCFGEGNYRKLLKCVDELREYPEIFDVVLSRSSLHKCLLFSNRHLTNILIKQFPAHANRIIDILSSPHNETFLKIILFNSNEITSFVAQFPQKPGYILMDIILSNPQKFQAFFLNRNRISLFINSFPLYTDKIVTAILKSKTVLCQQFNSLQEVFNFANSIPSDTSIRLINDIFQVDNEFMRDVNDLPLELRIQTMAISVDNMEVIPAIIENLPANIADNAMKILLAILKPENRPNMLALQDVMPRYADQIRDALYGSYQSFRVR